MNKVSGYSRRQKKSVNEEEISPTVSHVNFQVSIITSYIGKRDNNIGHMVRSSGVKIPWLRRKGVIT